MIGELIEFQTIQEKDGNLTYFENSTSLPFLIKRCFYIFDVPENTKRANHASISTEFVLIAMNGSVEVSLDDGKNVSSYILNNRTKGLYVPSMIWMQTKEFSNDAVLLVLASTNYKDCVYVDNYDDFVEISKH